jgi:hypothetical protein
VTERPGDGCPVLTLSPGSVIAEFWLGNSRPVRAEGFAITRDEVSGVFVAGRTIRTYREPELASDLRAVTAEVRGAVGGTVTVPPLFPGRPPHKVSRELPRFSPRDLSGRELTSSTDEPVPAYVFAEGNSWHAPESEPSGLCRIHTDLQSKVRAAGGFVATSVPAMSEVLGQAFLSCANTSYNVDGTAFIVSVLADAERPGRRPPPLPGERAVPSRQGVFEALASSGTILARRDGPVWLAVGGGRSQSERRAVLDNVSATTRF